MLSVGKDLHDKDNETSRAASRGHWKKSDHPLVKPLIEFEDRRDSGHLKRRAEIAPMMLRAGEMCQTVRNTAPLRVANVELANVAADDECIVINNNIAYSNFCFDLTEKLRRASSSCSIPTACLASSSSSDLLTLMYNRTRHGILRIPIESTKSKLVKG